MSYFSLEGKVAIVTGAASGLGLATARRFAGAGAKVIIADITDCTDIAKEIDGYYKETNVTKEADVKELMEYAVETLGGFDILVNNAGIIGPEQMINEANLDEYRKIFDVNVFGVVHGLKYGGKYINDNGVILNTASNSANGDYPGYGAYIASKTSVVGLTKAAAIDLAPRGIRVNCICPNTIDTPMAYVEGCETELAVMKVTTPLGRMCKPEEGAALYHFLASDDCMYITGEDIYIDGGLKAGSSTQLIDAILTDTK